MKLKGFILGLLVATTFAISPLSALAQTGISFGGKVISVIPCFGGMFHVTIVPAGGFPPTYIWTPATITTPPGIPIPGGQVLGVADIPFVCFVGGGFFFFPVPLYGLRMQSVGISPPGI